MKHHSVGTFIMKRKVTLFGHILKHNRFITNILEGKVTRRWPIKNPNHPTFSNIKHLKNTHVTETFGYKNKAFRN